MSALTTNTLRVGDIAPAFTLSDIDGRLFDLSDVLQGGPLLLFFAPGTWSPTTRRQIAELETVHDDLQALRLTTIMIITEDVKHARHALGPLLRTSDKSFLGPLLSFPILLDTSRNTSRDYGVYRTWSRDGFHVTRPAVFFVGASGEVRFIHVGKGETDVPDMKSLLRLIEHLVASEKPTTPHLLDSVFPELEAPDIQPWDPAALPHITRRAQPQIEAASEAAVLLATPQDPVLLAPPRPNVAGLSSSPAAEIPSGDRTPV